MAKTRKLAVVNVPVPAPRIETREFRFDRALGNVTRFLDDKVEESTRTLAKFQERFAQNALDALSWGNGAFEAAANQKVFSEVASVIRLLRDKQAEEFYTSSSEKTLKVLCRQVMRETLRTNRYRKQSTSVTSNEIESYIGCAYAAISERLEMAYQYADEPDAD